MRTCLAILLALATAGCLEVDAPNGSLKCSSDPNRLCPHGYFCAVDNTCWKDGSTPNAHPRTLGSACVSRDDCDSGLCVDGVCCNSPCSDACQACDLVRGQCLTIQGKPHGFRACPSSDVPMCAATCDGSSTLCTYPGASTACEPQACIDGTPPTLKAATYCNGAGFCGLPDGGMLYSSCPPPPANAKAVCSGDHCDFACTPPYVRQGAGCVPGDM